MRTLVVLTVLTLLAGPAAAFGTTFASDVTDFSEEPDTDADDNGIPEAREGLAPVRILNAKWINDATPLFTGGLTQTDAVALFGGFGSRFILPLATGQFQAWYGDWTDIDQDGRLSTTEAQYVGAGLTPRTCDDIVGIPGAVVGDCSRGPSEWTSVRGANVFSYVSPNAPSTTLVTNNLGIENLEDLLDPPQEPAGEPDITYGPWEFPEGGRYIAPTDGGTFFFVDNSALETTTVETLVNPVPSSGARTIAAAEGEPTDVDVYSALDPALESIWHDVVVSTVASTGCSIDRPWGVLTDAECLSTLPTGDTSSVDPTAGPLNAALFPGIVNEDDGRDHTVEPRLYFDVHVDLSLWQPLIVAAGDGSAGPFSPDASGRAGAPAYMGVYGRLGLWHDVNADGWIGDPEPASGCPDAYDCGMTADPNDYASPEWDAFCRATDRPVGEVLATLTSSEGTWGSGVYVMVDHDFYGLTTLGFAPDWYEFDGTSAVGYSWYDDAALDLADGNPDHLVTEGPIGLHLNCGGLTDAGWYRSYEKILFPEGGNRGYDIVLETVPFEERVLVQGVLVDEPAYDRDVVPAMPGLVP